MKVYKVKVSELNGTMVWKDIESLFDVLKLHIDESNEGDIITIEVTEMSEEEFDTLPESDGY